MCVKRKGKGMSPMEEAAPVFQADDSTEPRREEWAGLTDTEESGRARLTMG